MPKRLINPAFILSNMIKHHTKTKGDPKDVAVYTLLKETATGQRQIFIFLCAPKPLIDLSIKFETTTIAHVQNLLSVLTEFFGFDAIGKIAHIIVHDGRTDTFYRVIDDLGEGDLVVELFNMCILH